jgi:glutaredoxin
MVAWQNHKPQVTDDGMQEATRVKMEKGSRRRLNMLEDKGNREMVIAMRLLFTIVILLFGMQGLSFGEATQPFGRPFMIAAQQTAKVELYVTDWCTYCAQAIKFLRANNIPYTAYDIEKDKAAAKRKERLSPGHGVPFAMINGKGIYGFSKEIYSAALGLK